MIDISGVTTLNFLKFKDMHKNSATRLREENDILRSQNESIITRVKTRRKART